MRAERTASKVLPYLFLKSGYELGSDVAALVPLEAAHEALQHGRLHRAGPRPLLLQLRLAQQDLLLLAHYALHCLTKQKPNIAVAQGFAQTQSSQGWFLMSTCNLAFSFVNCQKHQKGIVHA